ncbi:hypothetical protein L6164_010729 [Bauhinia variegata]|uniref:Uncharacterized protein n=1 Tax=Bauhinia variegata TaxID=167791 RepID=A0ACB9P447_BAUVA|nr:hypothetical protein L6164_010729 [Bauhinia variegata]
MEEQKHTETTTKMNAIPRPRHRHRHRPLHACGVSVLTIADLGYNRIASPLIYALQYQWLAILSFIDDHILAVEKMIENLFPSSAYAFDKIDQLVQLIESVPHKLDDAIAVNRFPAPMEWALFHLISCLNSLISTFNRWGPRITIDVVRKGNKESAEKKGAVAPFESTHKYREELERGQSEKSQNAGEYYSAYSPVFPNALSHSLKLH